MCACVRDVTRVISFMFEMYSCITFQCIQKVPDGSAWSFCLQPLQFRWWPRLQPKFSSVQVLKTFFYIYYSTFSSFCIWQDGWISTLSWDSVGIVLNRLGDGVFLLLLPLSMTIFDLVGSQENTITPNLIFQSLHCSNARFPSCQ